jgi:hypothetical protein
MHNATTRFPLCAKGPFTVSSNSASAPNIDPVDHNSSNAQTQRNILDLSLLRQIISGICYLPHPESSQYGFLLGEFVQFSTSGQLCRCAYNVGAADAAGKGDR